MKVVESHMQTLFLWLPELHCKLCPSIEEVRTRILKESTSVNEDGDMREEPHESGDIVHLNSDELCLLVRKFSQIQHRKFF